MHCIDQVCRETTSEKLVGLVHYGCESKTKLVGITDFWDFLLRGIN